MPDTLSAALAGLIGIIAGAFTTYFTTRSRIRTELSADYDKSLRDARIDAYRGLWKELQPLAKYSRPGPVSYRTVQQLSSVARRWYFETGGLYLSERAREAYFALMDGYRDVLENLELQATPDRELSTPEFESLRDAGSRLRATMAADVRTRRTLLAPN